MTAYLRALVLRWTRNPIGLEAFVGSFGAPLFFTGAIFFLFNYGPYAESSPDDAKHMLEGVFVGVIMLSVLSSSLSYAYVMTRTIHVEKLRSRVTLLRTSGLDGSRAVLCFLGVSVLLSLLFVPMSLVGAYLLNLAVEVPPVTLSLVLVSIAMVVALSPVVIGARLFFEQPIALTLSSGTALFGTGYIVGVSEAGPIEHPLAYLVRLGAVWLLGCTVLLLSVVRQSRTRRRGWN